MNYVMSDLHGRFDLYSAMLEKIRFSADDTLFVLGDVVDRGPDPVRILKDMAARENVFPIMGNHDAMALELLNHLMVEITAENCDSHLQGDVMSYLLDWQLDGGMPTISAFQKLKADERADLLDYMADFSIYETVDVGGRSFILVHAGLQNFDPKRPLSSYRADEMIMGRHDYGRQYYQDPSVFIVTGHTPTLKTSGRAEILHSCNNICIDCGAAYRGGRLACLCLDTMEEFYTE